MAWLPELILILIGEVMWYVPKSNFTASAQATIMYNNLEYHTFKSTATSVRDQWINSSRPSDAYTRR